MRDVHIHFLHGDKQGYSQGFFEGFLKKAVEMNLDEIYLLEHTHHFREFEPVYASVMAYNGLQREWLAEDLNSGSAEDYLRFIETADTGDYPVKVKFGLEVCYIPETADKLANILGQYQFDFLTGGVHWIDGWAFDFPSQKELWQGRNIDEMYRRYYKIMLELCESGLFTGLAHPDSIKCFGHFPACDLTEEYSALAEALNRNGMYAEHSGGLKLRYNPELELGMNGKLLDVLIKHNTAICTASDAHRLSDVGAYIRELGKDLAIHD